MQFLVDFINDYNCSDYVLIKNKHILELPPLEENIDSEKLCSENYGKSVNEYEKGVF